MWSRSRPRRSPASKAAGWGLPGRGAERAERAGAGRAGAGRAVMGRDGKEQGIAAAAAVVVVVVVEGTVEEDRAEEAVPNPGESGIG